MQEGQHSTFRISKASSVSANNQSAASNNKTFQSWIKLKGFDESLEMNMFTLHADGGITCLLCSEPVWSNCRPAAAFSVARGSIREKSSNLKFVEKRVRSHLTPTYAG